MPFVRRNISLPSELNKKLIAQAAIEERNISMIVRRALKLYLKKMRRETRKEAEHETI